MQKKLVFLQVFSRNIWKFGTCDTYFSQGREYQKKTVNRICATYQQQQKTYSVTERPAHEGINPSTKQKIQIAAKKVAKFKPGAELADAVNA